MRLITVIFVGIFLFGCKRDTKSVVDYSPPENANYLHEDVVIKLHCGDILAGSLTYQDSELIPAAILITGSSAHDRDNSKPERPIGSYRPFRQISDVLSSNGIAVLRMDDRGVARSKGGDINQMTTEERAEDIGACVRYMKDRPEFDSSRICLIGLSEGASIAHMIASTDHSIKGLVLLSGIGSLGRDIINYQVKNGLISKKGLSKILKRDINLSFLYDYDPLETIRLINQPVLIIQGQSDRRVPYRDAYIIIEELRKNGNTQVSVHVLPEYNHLLLKEDSTGKQTSYGRVSSNRIPDEVLSIILKWVQEEI